MVTPSSLENSDAGTHSIEKSFDGSPFVTILSQQSQKLALDIPGTKELKNKP
jgi:hypothetical protein